MRGCSVSVDHTCGPIQIAHSAHSDNHNRTVGSIRSVFNKKGGTLGTNGSLSFLFDRKGVFTIPKGELDPEEFELELIDAGVEEFESETCITVNIYA